MSGALDIGGQDPAPEGMLGNDRRWGKLEPDQMLKHLRRLVFSVRRYQILGPVAGKLARIQSFPYHLFLRTGAAFWPSARQVPVNPRARVIAVASSAVLATAQGRKTKGVFMKAVSTK